MLFPGNRHLWRVWRAGIRASLTRELEFRTNFLLGLLRQLFWFAGYVIVIEIIFTNVDTLSGWTQSEALLILALSRLNEGIINLLFAMNIMDFPRVVQTGQFDFVLTKPVPAQFYMAFKHVNLYQFGNISIGLLLFIYALLHLPGTVGLGSFLLLAVLSALGITIFYALLIMVAALVFFLERLEALWSFMTLFSEPLTVPFDIFPRATRITLTYILPIAFVVFVPAQSLTGRLDWWQVPVAIVMTIVFLVLANLAWRAGLRRYSSASS